VCDGEAPLAGEARWASGEPGRPGTTRARTPHPYSACSTTSRWRVLMRSTRWTHDRVFIFDWDVHHARAAWPPDPDDGGRRGRLGDG
jgi:hypothetical protein